MSNSNPMLILASMLGTLVAGSGVYMQWIEFNDKKEEKSLEIQQQSMTHTQVQSNKNNAMPLTIEPLTNSHLAAATTNPNKTPLQIKPIKSSKNTLDDLDLAPPPKNFNDDFDIDETGF